MKRLPWIRLLLLTACVAFGVAKIEGGIVSHAPETASQRVLRTGVLRCGYGLSPPALSKDPNTGALSGLNVDIWDEVGRLLDVKVEWTEETGWGNFIEGLRDGRYDAFCSGMFPDAARSKFLTLSLPFLYDPIATFVRADDRRFDGDLEKINAPDVTLPAIDGDVSAMAFHERFPKARLLSLPQTANVADMFLSVASGKADALFLDEAMFSALDQNNPGALRRVDNVPPALVFPMYFGFNAGETSLRDSVNVALQRMIDTGALAALAQRYAVGYRAPRGAF